jgi:hypothetical protein
MLSFLPSTFSRPTHTPLSFFRISLRRFDLMRCAFNLSLTVNFVLVLFLVHFSLSHTSNYHENLSYFTRLRTFRFTSIDLTLGLKAVESVQVHWEHWSVIFLFQISLNASMLPYLELLSAFQDLY